MLYPFITIGLAAAFLGYILYLIIAKKNLRAKFQSHIMPGIFVVGIWALLYFCFLR